jgi:hypothetical protein
MDRQMLVVCCAMAFGAHAALTAADVRTSAGGFPAPPASMRAIRSASRDSRLAELLVHGMARSPTLRSLVASLEASDVVVHVFFAQSQKRNGYLVHQMAVGGPYRYLRVMLKAALSNREVIPVLAHELQHALEVAQSPRVRDSDDIRALFERIGFPALESAFVHETEEALRVQRQVRADLRP